MLRPIGFLLCAIMLVRIAGGTVEAQQQAAAPVIRGLTAATGPSEKIQRFERAAGKVASVLGGLVELPLPEGFDRIFEDSNRFAASRNDYSAAIAFASGYVITTDIGWNAEIPKDAVQIADMLMGQPARRYDWTTTRNDITTNGQPLTSLHRVWIFDNCLPEKAERLGVRIDGGPDFVESASTRAILDPLRLTKHLIACADGNAPATASATRGTTPQPETQASPQPAPEVAAPAPQKAPATTLAGDRIVFKHMSMTLPQGWTRVAGTPGDQPRYASPAGSGGAAMTIMLTLDDPQPRGKPRTLGVDVLSTRVLTIGGNGAILETWHHTATDSFGQTLSLEGIEAGKDIRVVAWAPRPEWAAAEPSIRAIFASIASDDAAESPRAAMQSAAPALAVTSQRELAQSVEPARAANHQRELASVWNPQRCAFTDTSEFRLPKDARIDRIDIWYKWRQTETASPFEISDRHGEMVAQGMLQRDSCDPNQAAWCVGTVALQLSLRAGTYYIQTPRKRICQNEQSGGTGFVKVWGRSAARSGGAEPDPNMQLGNRWTVHEETPDGRSWDGVWTRRGNSNVFDAEWRDSLTRQSLTDVIELREVTKRSVTLYRRGLNGTYHGRISPDGTGARGDASWYPEGGFWTAEIGD